MSAASAPRVRRLFAVLSCLLIVTSMVTPVMATGSPVRTERPAQGQTPFDRPTSAVDETSPPTATDSISHRQAAVDALQESDLPGDKNISRLLTMLNGTVDAYIDRNRVSRSVFETDKRVATRTQAHAPAVKRALLASDAKLARVSVADAKRVLSQAKARNVSADYDAAEADLAAAEKALEKGATMRERANPSAFEFYRKAWVRSQRALDRVDAATTPNVTITTREDFPHNESVTYPIRGQVWDVRTTDLTNATVTVNGKTTNLTYAGNSTPGGVGHVSGNVTLSRSVNELVVSVTDPGTTYATSQTEAAGESRKSQSSKAKGGTDTGAPEEGTQESREDSDSTPTQTGSDTLLLDGDGLPDTYERQVTGTDPRNPDSNSSLTEADEGGDSVIDGLEDFDGDELNTYREYRLGTDPLDTDTDGDRLTDGFEARYSGVGPLTVDYNDTGTRDDRKDRDDDGLTNYQEQSNGTNPLVADTDRDGLSDSNETSFVTNATLYDTDRDGLADGTELKLGTNPVSNDTDADGVLDGNESYTSSVSNATLNTSVSVTGSGYIASGVSIENGTSARFQTSTLQGARVAPLIEIESDRSFDSANITFSYDTDAVDADETTLAIARFNRSTQTFELLNSTVDSQNGTITAETPHFSRYTVLDVDEWVGALDASAPGTGDSIGVIEPRSQPEFDCVGACEIQNETTILLGGEPTSNRILVEQGNKSVEVVPLSNGQEITTFYNYGNNQLNSPLPIAKSDSSRLFFWSGPRGISLVTLHDKPYDGSGGAVSFEFGGLPTGEGSWVVKDDGPDFEDGPTSPDWAWNLWRTDGGAFRGGLTNQTVTITPKFNGAADRDPITPGRIESWEVLTGQATSPQSFTLDKNEPVTITIPESPNESDTLAGDTGRASFEYALGADEDELVVVYQTEQTGTDPAAELVITGPNGTTVTEPLSIGTVGTVEETIDVSELSAGSVNVSLHADGVNLKSQVTTGRVDSDGDGLPDGVEAGIDTGVGEIQTNPSIADTDGDGLSDGEEVGEYVERTLNAGDESYTVSYYKLHSDPRRIDTDKDLVTDDTERVWESNPWKPDTDGDEYPDLIDPNHSVDNSPVAFTARSRNWGESFVISEVKGGEIKDISIEAYYTPTVVWDDPFWEEDRGDWYSLNTISEDKKNVLISAGVIKESDKHWVTIEQHGWENEAPDKYNLTVTDKAGNTVTYQVIPQSGSGAKIKTVSATLAGGAVVATPGVPDEGVIIGAGVALALVADQVGNPFSDGASDRRTFEKTVYLTETVDLYLWQREDGIDLPVRLPAGAVYEAPEPAGEQHDRRWGGEQILRVPGINDKEAVEEVLKTPDAVSYEYGEYTVVIGDAPASGQEDLLLYLLGNTIVAANPIVERYPEAEYGEDSEKRDEEDETVLREQQREHIENDHPEMTKQRRKQVIQNPDEVWVTQTPEGQDLYMWVKEINGVIYIVRGAYLESIGETRIGTGFKPTRGYQYVRDWLEDNGATKVYG